LYVWLGWLDSSPVKILRKFKAQSLKKLLGLMLGYAFTGMHMQGLQSLAHCV